MLKIGESALENCEKLESIIMNKECEINNQPSTICSMSVPLVEGGRKYWFYGTIYGCKGSTAKLYAFNHDYKFEELPDISETTTTSTTSTTTSISTTTTTSTTTVTGQNQQKYPLGDINNDGQVNAVDASSILAYYAKVSTNKDGGFNEAQKLAADVDNDGQVNAVDASNILAYYAYVSTTKEDAKSLVEFLKK